jgi:murein DD-endopeptidase MepM/ murein hydrolase activator NlpD
MVDEPGITPDERLRQEEPPVSDEDTTPRPALSLEDKLRQEEPPISADDTSPSKRIALAEQLQQDEPPVSDEDTTPRPALSLEDKLRQEEPPVGLDDTSPSSFTQAGLAIRTGSSQRALGIVMLVGAALLTLIATVIWLDSGDDTGSAALSGAAVSEPQEEQPAAADVPEDKSPPAQSAPAEDTTAPQPETVTVALAAPLILPTAAADEIASALLVPVQDEGQTRAIQRENEPFTIRSNAARAGVVKYTVQKGDTLESIAEQFGLHDFYTIVWSNPANKINPLRPGVEITIAPGDGVYYEVTENVSIAAVAELYGVDPYAIIDSESNNLFGSTPDTLLVEGMGGVFVPGGEAERVMILQANTSGGTGYAAAGGVSGSYSLWGCTANVGGGSLPVSRPLDSYTWMQGFSIGGHTGVDLSPTTGIGTPVKAAGAGTVVYAGWNSGGYGNVVVIAHGPVFSLYAHLDSYSVRCGTNVSAGQVIGAAGNTGNSSGPHLHFEVRDADFNLRNPQDYVSF